MKQIEDKVVVITGAGSGIGLEFSLQFGALGARLAVNDWNKEALEATLQLLHSRNIKAIGSVFDVSDRRAMDAFAQKVWDTYQQVDIVINNAGLTVFAQPIIKMHADDIERTFNVNVKGVINGSMAFLPYLEQGDGGTLANMSSIFGIVGFAYQAPYVMSKFAVRGLTETLRQEYQAKKHVNICCIHPGGVRTNLVRNIKAEEWQNKERLVSMFDRAAPTSSTKAVAKIIRGIRRKKKRILIGPDAYFMDLLSRLFPSYYHRFLPKAFDPTRSSKVSKTPVEDKAKLPKV